MSTAVDPNLTPVLVAGGGGGAAIPAAPASVLLDAGAPSTIVGLNGSGVGAALTGAQAREITGALTVDAMAGTGWATAGSVVGGATAVWGGGALTLTTQTGVAGEINVGSTTSIPTGGDSDVYLRVDVATGDVAAGADGSLIWRVGTDADNSVQAQLKSDGTVVVYSWVDTTPTEILGATATGITTGERTGGQLWYRWCRRGSGLALLWGVGSAGALPERWRTIAAWTTAVALTGAFGVWHRVGVLSGAISGGYVLAVHAIRATGYGVGPL